MLASPRSTYGLDPKHISAAAITQKVIQGVYDGVTTVELDNLAAETAAYQTTQHPDYARLAARISVANLHKMTNKSFSSTMDALHSYVNPRNGQKAPLIADDVHQIIMENAERLDAAIMCVPRRAAPPMRFRTARHTRSGRGGLDSTRIVSSVVFADGSCGGCGGVAPLASRAP